MIKCFTLSSLFYPLLFFSQSISSEKLITYARHQNLNIIEKDLDYKGFITKKDNVQLGAVKIDNTKIVVEVLFATISSNQNSFAVCYKSPLYYVEKKRSLLTSNFTFIKESNGTLIYDNPIANYRIDINDSEQTLCIYTEIK